MKTISAELQAHYDSGNHTLAHCIKLTLTNADIVAATTYHDDIVFDGVTYLSASGGTISDIENSCSLSVNNGEIKGLLVIGSLNRADVLAGKYDFAELSLFEVNYADLTQGSRSMLDGWIGDITCERNPYTAEYRGRSQALSRTIGHVCAPLCHARLGDAECKKDLTAFTVAGNLEGVSDDNCTMFDSARTEPGPSGGVSITNVSNANPGVVTTSAALSVANGAGIVISGVEGMTPINGVTVVRNKSGNTFELGIDTSDTAVYPAYTSGGTVTPTGGDSGYFDYGVMTFTGGANNGLSMEVKAYVPGQWTLQLPMPYAVAVSDAYNMVAGCNKQITTCNTKFNNHLNFSGRPYVPGQDAVVQIGRHS